MIIDYLKKNFPKERQLLAIDWNFDNSKDVIKWIVEQPDTDKGTALFLYWYMNPQYFRQYENREDCKKKASWLLEDYDIVETLEKIIFQDFIKIKNMLLILKMTHIIQIMIGQKKLTKKK